MQPKNEILTQKAGKEIKYWLIYGKRIEKCIDELDLMFDDILENTGEKTIH